MSTVFTIGYSDFIYEIADEITAARHVRYIGTPSGRKLYLPLAKGATQADDDEALQEIRRLVAAANGGAASP